MNDQQRGDYATQVLENPVFNEAFDIVHAAYLDGIVHSKPEDQAKRERMYQCLNALVDVKNTLTQCVEIGKIDLANTELLAKQI